MGHGGQTEEGATLLFENTFGNVDSVSAIDFTRSVRRAAFLVTLNACVTATPGETEFANLAAGLVGRKIPYSLGMRFSIPDEDARTFSRVFYGALGQGAPVEEAVRQARFQLSRGEHPWMVGLPVLYTALDAPATGFASQPGQVSILDPQLPTIEITPLPQTDGIFHGRIAEMLGIGKALTGDDRPRLLTIHGGGGQGKTALAREVAQRFAYAFPGGVWAFSLENLPTKDSFVAAMARFLNISLDEYPRPEELEAQLLRTLPQRRRLLILDNAETLVEAVDKEDPAAIELSQFLRRQVSHSSITFLATSRRDLGWPGEVFVELKGLTPADGAALFHENSGRRQDTFTMAQAEALSQTLGGHPLSLRLLAGAYNESIVPFDPFLREYEGYLQTAEDKLQESSHRHRSLSASVAMSVQFLTEDLRHLLSGLWIFHSPFLPETAVAIFDPDTAESEGDTPSPVLTNLAALHRRSLLAMERVNTSQGRFLLYRLLPTLRPFLQRLPQAFDSARLQQRFGLAMAILVDTIYRRLNEGGMSTYLPQQCVDDFSRGLQWVDGETEAHYCNHWGYIVQRLGDRRQGLALLERGLELAEGRFPQLVLDITNNMGGVYRAIGQPQLALALFKQALPIHQEAGDRVGEATTLANMGAVYCTIGQPQQALDLFKQALPIRQEVGDRAREAATLSNMSLVYSAIGQPQQALDLYHQALPIHQEVGDRAREAAILANMGTVYRDIGQPQQALTLFNQALPIIKEVGDRAGQASTLNNMGNVYRDIGQPQQALDYFKETLPIRQEVGDRAGEAVTLANMGGVYRAIGQPQQALTLFNQALPIIKEVGDRAGQASTLNNMGTVYLDIGQPQLALDYFKEALPISQEVGDRAGEANTLSSMGAVYLDIGQPQLALDLFNQALPIQQEVGNRAGQAATLSNMGAIYFKQGKAEKTVAMLQQVLEINRETKQVANEAATLKNLAIVLHNALGQTEEAITYQKQAIALLEQYQLTQDAAGATLQQHKQFLDELGGTEPDNVPAATSPADATGEPNFIQVIRAFVNAESWTASRTIVEQHQDLLLSPQATEILDQHISQAQAKGDEQAVTQLQTHRDLLLHCIEVGIEAAFSQIENSRQAELPFPRILDSSDCVRTPRLPR